jgi:hypothetical protein
MTVNELLAEIGNTPAWELALLIASPFIGVWLIVLWLTFVGWLDAKRWPNPPPGVNPGQFWAELDRKRKGGRS